MSFLKRLFGGEPERDPEAEARLAEESVADEQARERQLLRDEAERLGDDLIQRQMRYANYRWTPPAEGGSRRADDEDADADG